MKLKYEKQTKYKQRMQFNQLVFKKRFS